MFENLLPIGSVITLKNGKKKLMVFGIKQHNQDDNKEYDYIGVIYPEGNLGAEYQFLFNHENIAEVHFKGFEDEERTSFMENLKKHFEN